MTDFILTFDPSAARVTSLLNGRWQIAGGDAERPLQAFERTIPVPSLVDCAEPSYGWRQYEYHWYRTEFTIRGEGEIRSIFLKLQQSMYGTLVKINGQTAGSSISCYTAQTYKIDEYCSESAPNEILVRVGSRSLLPAESAAGRDQERDVFIPGIWGDAELFACGEVRVNSIQTIPHCRRSVAEVRVAIENFSSSSRQTTIVASVQEKHTKRPASDLIPKQVALSAYGTETVTFQIPIEGMKLWSPDAPFLYTVCVTVAESSLRHDALCVSFGMREFTIEGRDFYLNGKKIFLRGGNIALHRFFSDRMRRLLPWDERWITRVLVEIPKAHNFNFFRAHIGPLYHRWYDIADEHGILLQDEWPFWGATGSKRQITREFTEWIADRCNHPSIVIWDPLNESSDETIRHEIIPMMKRLDPTRPWESVDCFEQHPYIYSLGMVLNGRRLGFSESLDAIKDSPTPSMVNEFLWWWLDAANAPTSLMKGVIERWLGRAPSAEEVVAHQSFLARELVELFRRLNVRAIQPFVYLSNNDGPTGNWFEGDIAKAQPKPVLAALKNAFAPFGVSIELWDRHFTVGECKQVRIFLFNDTPFEQRGTLCLSVTPSHGRSGQPAEPEELETINVMVPAGETKGMPVDVEMPRLAGTYTLRAELRRAGEAPFVPSGGAHAAHEKPPQAPAVSEKILHVFEPVRVGAARKEELASRCRVLDPSGEIPAFLGLAETEFALDRSTRLIITHGNVVMHASYQDQLKAISAFVRRGGVLLVIEPEYRVAGAARVALTSTVELAIEQRADLEKGGYDSYVFAEDESHPFWAGITREHLKMFNGAYGGEAVSEYAVTPSVRFHTHAICGLGLATPALFEIPHAQGRIIVSRVQCRGRLVPAADDDDASLFARRADAVMQKLLLNMIDVALGAEKSRP